MSTVNEKMTTLANRIRNYSDRTGKLSIDDMAIAVEDVYVFGMVAGRTQGYEQGYENGWAAGLANGREEGKASVPFEVHKITVASDLTSGNNILFSNNDFIKEHYADDGFYFQLISITEHTTGFALGYAYNGNRAVSKVGTYNYCGFQANLGGGTSINVKATTGNCTTANWNAVPYVTDSGDVCMNNNTTNGTVQAGDYLLILSVAEV